MSYIRPRDAKITVPRRRSRLKRLIVWVVGLSAMFAALLMLLVYYVPLSWDGLEKSVEEQLRAASGELVVIDEARLSLAQRTFTIGNLTFYNERDPENPTLSIRDVSIKFRPWAYLRGDRTYIEEIEINGPSPLELQYDSKGVRLGARAEFLRNALSNLRSRKTATTRGIAFRSLRIRGASVNLIESEPGEPRLVERGTTAGVELHDCNVSLNSAGDKLGVEFDAMMVSEAGHSSSHIVGQGIVRGDSSVDLTISSPQLRVGQVISAAQEAGGSVDDLLLTLRVDKTSPTLTAWVGLQCDAFRFDAPLQDLSVEDQNLSLTARLGYDTDTGVVSLESGSVASRSLGCDLMGQIGVSGIHEFDARLHASRVGGAYQSIIARLLPSGYRVKADEDSLQAEAAAKGSANGLSSLVGKLKFTSLTLTSRNFQKPLSGLKGEIDFEPGRVVFHDLAGHYGHTDLQLKGDLSGEYLTRREGTLALEWSAASTADDLIGLLQQQPRAMRTASSVGTISSTGRYEQFVSLSPNRAPGPARIKGQIDIRDVGFSNSLLPAPVRNLTGRLDIEDNAVRASSLRGQMEGGEVTVNGVALGDGVFWKDPRLTATLDMKADLGKLVAYMPPKVRESAERYNIQGQLLSRLNVFGELRHLDRSEFTGTASIQGASFDPNLAFLSGMFADVNADVSWDGTTLKVGQLTGKINGETVKAGGSLSPSRIQLALDSHLDLQGVPASFPRMKRTMDMSGPATVKASFVVDDSTGPEVVPSVEPGFGGRLVPLLTMVTQRLDQAVEKRTYRLDGTVVFEGARIRHNAMPVAYTNAREQNIPEADINWIFGTAILSGASLSAPADAPLKCNLANTENCLLDGTLTFRPQNWPLVNFRLRVQDEAFLDSWVTKWGTGLPKLVTPPAELTGKSFELLGRISSARTSFKGYKAGPMRMTISFLGVQGQPSRTEFRDIQLEGSRGRLTASGFLESFSTDKSGAYPHWAAQVDVRNMEFRPLLGAIFTNEVRNLEALATTQIKLEAHGKELEKIRGGGTGTLTDLVIGRTSVGQYLGQATGQNLEGTRFGTATATHYDIANGAISTSDLQLETRGIRLDVRGSYFFDRRIDAVMRVGFFETVLGPVPIVGQLAQIVDRAAGHLLLHFKVSGAADHPTITPVALPVVQGLFPILQQ